MYKSYVYQKIIYKINYNLMILFSKNNIITLNSNFTFILFYIFDWKVNLIKLYNHHLIFYKKIDILIIQVQESLS